MPATFADLGVSARLVATLTRRGLTAPFPIQEATLPDALAGRDIAGKAPTGSGKTLAFGLVVATRAAEAGRARPRRPRALVLAPTRELAAQVQRELQALIERDAGPVVAVYGGVGYGPQRKALDRGASAVVACPGRLEDLIASGAVDLRDVDLVVIDEADRMADMGFMPAVRRIVDQTSPSRQTLLFSATLDGDVDALVKRYQHDPARHEVAGHDDDGVDVVHMFWRVPRAQRIAVTAEVVRRTGSTIIFSRTRHGADRIARQLGQAGVKAVPIHGRRSQGQRDQALAAFSSGRAPALVATDVAARGIHVDDVGCVLHFDLPPDAKDYVHRSGRTGRAGATGVVIGLVTEETGKLARTLKRELGRPEPVEDVDLDRLPAASGHPVAVTPVEAAPVARPVAASPDATGAGDRAARRTERTSRTGRHQRRGDGERAGSGRDRGPRTNGHDRPRTGTVASFNADKGWGFISRGGDTDVFVHVSNLDTRGDVLRPGQRVRFELAPGKRGQQAVKVRPA